MQWHVDSRSLTLVLTLTDTGGAVLTLMLGYSLQKFIHYMAITTFVIADCRRISYLSNKTPIFAVQSVQSCFSSHLHVTSDRLFCPVRLAIFPSCFSSSLPVITDRRQTGQSVWVCHSLSQSHRQTGQADWPFSLSCLSCHALAVICLSRLCDRRDRLSRLPQTDGTGRLAIFTVPSCFRETRLNPSCSVRSDQ